jgi:predicted DNA-binding protein (MmcQ/YjbR family)
VTPAELSDHALAKPGAWADQPWEGDFVAKVDDGRGAGKIFAFLGSTTVGVKAAATREVADEWLDRYPDDATPMAYIGRSGWNSLVIGGSIPDEEILEAVDESYRLVVSRLPKKHRPTGWEE